MGVQRLRSAIPSSSPLSITGSEAKCFRTVPQSPGTRRSNGERPEIGRNFVQPNHSKTRGTYMCRPQTLNHAAQQ
jgi:hypothetical protein